MTTVFNLESITSLSRKKFYQLQEKMQEYLDSGLKLGWLINPQQKQVEIYRQNKEVEIVNMPVDLSGEDILPQLRISLDY
jgi:Uma2 family endonuclease